MADKPVDAFKRATERVAAAQAAARDVSAEIAAKVDAERASGAAEVLGRQP